MKKVFLNFILFLFLFLVACNSKDESGDSEVNIGTPVKITHPFKTTISDYIKLNGSTVFLTKEIIRATFQGFVEKVDKNIGDSIKPGEDIFQIKTIETAAADSLNISLGGKQFSGSIKLRAHSAGVLVGLNYHQGDFVSNGEQLAIISNPSSMRIKVNIPFEDVSKTKVGSNCDILLPGGETLKGVVDRNIPSVDSVTQTQSYFIKLIKYKTLPENLNVTVRIPFNKSNDVLVLPKSSIVTNVTQDSFWVMKLIDDSTAVKVTIKKGIENDSLVQILSPSFSPDERIITSGAYGLPDSSKVEIIR